MDLLLDDLTGDLALDENDLGLAQELVAVSQFVSQKMKFFLAEWFLDESEGIPYHDEIFVKNPKSVVIDTIFKTTILNAPGIIELLEYSTVLNGTTRKMSLAFRAKSEEGIVDFSEELPIGG